MNLPSIPRLGERPSNAVIVFANQKGGVGKTSLCTTFANYITSQGYPALVADCDNQQSIYKRRDADLKDFPDFQIRYNVVPFDINSIHNGQNLVDGARQVKGTVIIDSPGSLTQNGITPILLQADYIVCPFQYDKVTYKSTEDFIRFVSYVCGTYKMDMPQIIFVPNRINKGWGKKADFQTREAIENELKGIGVISPKVPAAADIVRYNTLFNTAKQTEIVKPCFDFIFNIIKDKLIK